MIQKQIVHISNCQCRKCTNTMIRPLVCPGTGSVKERRKRRYTSSGLISSWLQATKHDLLVINFCDGQWKASIAISHSSDNHIRRGNRLITIGGWSITAPLHPTTAPWIRTKQQHIQIECLAIQAYILSALWQWLLATSITLHFFRACCGSTRKDAKLKS